MDLTNLYQWWIKGLGGIIGGMRLLTREKIPCGNAAIELLKHYRTLIDILIKEMEEIEGK